jgi:hypothetical protein
MLPLEMTLQEIDLILFEFQTGPPNCPNVRENPKVDSISGKVS